MGHTHTHKDNNNKKQQHLEIFRMVIFVRFCNIVFFFIHCASVVCCLPSRRHHYCCVIVECCFGRFCISYAKQERRKPKKKKTLLIPFRRTSISSSLLRFGELICVGSAGNDECIFLMKWLIGRRWTTGDISKLLLRIFFSRSRAFHQTSFFSVFFFLALAAPNSCS